MSHPADVRFVEVRHHADAHASHIVAADPGSFKRLPHPPHPSPTPQASIVAGLTLMEVAEGAAWRVEVKQGCSSPAPWKSPVNSAPPVARKTAAIG